MYPVLDETILFKNYTTIFGVYLIWVIIGLVLLIGLFIIINTIFKKESDLAYDIIFGLEDKRKSNQDSNNSSFDFQDIISY